MHEGINNIFGNKSKVVNYGPVSNQYSGSLANNMFGDYGSGGYGRHKF
jgi:hypothetical protein